MLGNTVALVVVLLPVASFWFAVLWARPAVARVKVERQVLFVRDRVMDGILSGEITRDNPRARDAIRYCEFIEQNSKEITWFSVNAAARALHDSGVDPAVEARRRTLKAEACADMASAAGNRRLQEAEEDLDHYLAYYLVRGSSLWWILAPAQRISRILINRRGTAAQRMSRNSVNLPGELATELRESTRGNSPAAELWTGHHALV